MNSIQNPQGTWEELVARQARVTDEDVICAERQSWLDDELKTQCIQGGVFDQLGWLGQRLTAAFEEVACVEKYDPKLEHRAVLRGHHPSLGYGGNLAYGDRLLADKNRFALPVARLHELIHRVNQFDRLPSPHATPWNRKVNKILHPRAAMILSVMMERQAFAGQVVVRDLLKDIDDGWREPGEIPSPEGIEKRLQNYASQIDVGTGWQSEEGFIEHYANAALNDYDCRKEYLLARGDIEYVDLDLEELARLNEFIGLNTFTSKPENLTRYLDMKFSPRVEERLKNTCEGLKIANKPRRTINEAIQADGSTAEEFTRVSLGKAAEQKAALISVTMSGVSPQTDHAPA